MSSDNRKASIHIPFSTEKPVIEWGGTARYEFTRVIWLPLWLTRVLSFIVCRVGRR